MIRLSDLRHPSTRDCYPSGKILVPKNMSKSLSLIEARCRVLLWYVRILLEQSAGTESRSHGVRLETGGLTASELVQRKQIKVILAPSTRNLPIWMRKVKSASSE